MDSEPLERSVPLWLKLVSGTRVASHEAALGVRGRLGLRWPVWVEAPVAHGTADRIRCLVRVVERPSGALSAEAGTLKTVSAITSLFLTDVRRKVPVTVSYGDASATCVTDADGFAELVLDGPWDPGSADLDIVVNLPEHEQAMVFGRRVELMPVSTDLGVVSDLDDTVVGTEVADLRAMVAETLTLPPERRTVLPGVTALYRGLQRSPSGSSRPFFYVSTSPWNLAPMLARVLEANGIPGGSLFLADWVSADALLRRSSRDHKLGALESIIDDHPELPLLLIGDSGEADALIYAEAARRWPDRIAAILIWRIGDPDPEIIEATQQTSDEGTPMFVCADAVEAASHLVALDLATDDLVAAVKAHPR